MNVPTLEMRLHLPLDRFDLDVDCTSHKQVIGLFGPSGSGKTTWLESVAGLRRQARGKLCCGDTVWLESERGVNLPPEMRGIGYVPQDQRLFPHLNVRKNLLFASKRTNSGDSKLGTLFGDVVSMLELESLLERKTDDLSGGERQRVALGRALCSAPRLLLLDEPLSSLDGGLRHRILPFIKRIREHFDIPMLIVSHHSLELQILCDEVIALRAGKVVAQGEPTEVFTNSSTFSSPTQGGFENMLPGVLISTGDTTSQVKIAGENSPALVTYPIKSSVGDKVILGIPAQAILIANHRVDGISARNIIAARIENLRRVDGRDLILAQVEGRTEPLVVDVTAESIEEMKFEVGRAVFLIIKTSSIRVYENGIH